MMVEAARFSHGQEKMQMQDLSKLDASSFDAVIFPGGHGITKNLWDISGLSECRVAFECIKRRKKINL